MAEDLLIRNRIDNSELRAGMREAAGIIERGAADMDRVSAQAFSGMSSAIGRLGAQVAGAFAIREVIAAADAYQSVANRLQLVAASAEEAQRLQGSLFEMAQRTRTEFGATANLFTRLAQASEQLGASQADILAVTEAVSQSFAISGASTSEAASAIQQLGQGLQSARLQGDELRSVLENSPRLARALAEGLGVSVGELRALGEAGQLTSRRVFEALRGQATEIADEYATLAPTVEQSFTQLQNSVQRFIGETSEATGAGQALAGTISVVARNFDTLADAALIAGAAVGVRKLIPAVAELRSAITGVAAASAAEQAAAVRSAITDTSRAASAQRLAAAKVRQNAASVAHLRTVQQETVSLLAEARAAAQSATNHVARAAAFQRVTILERQSLATTTALTAATGALAAAQRAQAAAAGASAVATARFTSVLATSNVATGAAALASRGFSAVVAFLGGSVMAAATAGVVAIGAAYLTVARNARIAKEEQAEFLSSFTDLSDQQVAAQLALARLKLQTARGARNDAIDPEKGGLQAIDAEIRKQSLLVAALEEVQRARNLAQPTIPKTGKQYAEEELERLAKLRDAGDATKAELDRIRGIVAFNRQEMARLSALPQTDEIQAQRVALRQQIEALTREPPTVRARLQLREEAFREFLDTAQNALDRYDLTIRLNLGAEAQQAALQGVVAQQDAILDRLKDQTLEESKRLELMKQLADLREVTNVGTYAFDFQVPSVQQARAVFERFAVPGTVEASVQSLENALKAVTQAADDVDLARRIGDATGLQAAQIRLDGLTNTARRVEEAVARFVMTLPPEQRSRALERIRAAMQDAGLEASNAAESTDALTDNLRTIGNATRGVTQLADAFGDVDENVRQALDGLGGLLDGIADARDVLGSLKEAGKASGIGELFKSVEGAASLLSIGGGIASLVGSLFDRGPSPSEILIDENNQRLAELRTELQDTRASFGNLSRSMTAALGAASALEGLSFGDLLSSLTGSGPGRVDPNSVLDRAIHEQLREAGLSLEQFAAIVEDSTGLQVLDAQGYIVAGTLRQAAEALELAREKALQFGDSMSDLVQQSNARLDLFNLDEDPVEAFRAQIDIGRDLNLPKWITDNLAQFDVSTSEGQAAARAFLQDLYDKAGAGQLADALYGSGFENASEFIQWLVDTEDPIDRFGKGLDSMAGKMNDFALPPGFKKDHLAYLAAAPIGPAVNPAAYVPPTPPVSPPAPAPAAPPVTYNDNRTVNLTIPAPEGASQQDAREWARRIYTELEELDRDSARALAGRLSVEAR